MKNKVCKKCGKQLYKDYRKDMCENCLIKKTSKIKRFAKAICAVIVVLFSFIPFVRHFFKKGNF